jgi:hypothetical protein
MMMMMMMIVINYDKEGVDDCTIRATRIKSDIVIG